MSKMHRVPRGEQPDVNHISSLMEGNELSGFIMGHLILEGLLVQYLEAQPCAVIANILRTNFPQKAAACFDADLFDADFRDFLLIVNDQRNHFAHKLGHRMSFDDAFALAGQAAARGIDFSDDAIHNNRKFAKEYYPVQGIIWELFSNTSMQLAMAMHDKGVLYSMG
jgi:hypothetical protein